jgi:hypothetical protein
VRTSDTKEGLAQYARLSLRHLCQNGANAAYKTSSETWNQPSEKPSYVVHHYCSVGGVEHDGVIGDSEIVQIFEDSSGGTL